MTNTLERLACICIPLLLTACATQPAPIQTDAVTPPQWYAPMPGTQEGDTNKGLPHGGSPAALSQWWLQQGDPVLVSLIDAAQVASPSLAQAGSRIVEARATHVAAGAALLPTLDAVLSAARTSAQPPLPVNTVAQARLESSWEIDLFGGNRASRDAAQARLEAAHAGWHSARVSLAAEVANQYYSLRACEKLLAIAVADAASRSHIARLTELRANAGFQAPAAVALARASAADGNERATQQQARCELDIKALVALTALPEPELRRRLAAPPPEETAPLAIATLPAQVLAQRPDVYAAEREVAAASEDIGSAQADRYPRLTLSGSVGAAKFRAAGLSDNLSTWSIGPLALSMPLFDGGRRAANVEAAQARYEAAASSYRATVRQAVREVEEALIVLHSTATRREDALAAASGYRTSFNAVESLYRNGMANLLELEDSRRTMLVADSTVVVLERERRAAWVALYRAAGGGWSTPSPDANAQR